MGTRHLVCALCMAGVLSAPSAVKITDTPATIWRNLLAAKGGVDRLHSIRGFTLSVDLANPSGWSRRDAINGGHLELVAVLPDKTWRATDYRPGTMGFSVDVFNREQKRFWTAWNGENPIEIEWTQRAERGMDSSVDELQLVLFAETSTLRPVPVKVANRGSSIVLEVQCPRFPSVTYVINPTTSLPSEIVLRALVEGTDGALTPANYTVTYKIDSYQEVEGVVVPRVIREYGSARVSLNPKVSPALFETAPRGLLTTDAWRKYLVK